MKKIINKNKKFLLSTIALTFVANTALTLISCSTLKQQEYDNELMKINTNVQAKFNYKGNRMPFALSNQYSLVWRELLSQQTYSQNGFNGAILKDKLKSGYFLQIDSIEKNEIAGSDKLILYVKLVSPYKDITFKKVKIEVSNLEKNIDFSLIFNKKINIKSLFEVQGINQDFTKNINIKTLSKLLSGQERNILFKNGLTLPNNSWYKISSIENNIGKDKTSLNAKIDVFTFSKADEFDNPILDSNSFKQTITIEIDGFKANLDSELPAKKDYIYFWFKPDNPNDYKNWGLHIWGEGYTGDVIQWTEPILFGDKDENGNVINVAGFYRATVKNADILKGVNYIIHKGDLKNNTDATIPKNEGNEFWFTQGNVNPNSDRPKYLISEFSRVAKNQIVLKLAGSEKEKNIDPTLLKLYDLFTDNEYEKEKYTVEYLRKNENSKHFHILKVTIKDKNITLGDKFFAKFGSKGNLINVGEHTYSRQLLKMEQNEYDENENSWVPDLGATLSDDFKNVNIKLWAPVSKTVHIQLYDKNNKNNAVGNAIELKRGNDKKESIFEINLNKENTNLENFDGYFYELILNKGTKFEKIVLDPYAKSMASFSPEDNHPGKGAFVNFNSPRAGVLSPSKGIFSGNMEGKLNKMIATEIHVRDYTITQNIPDKGTFKGFANWDKGIEYLKEIGYTHVQFLPLQNYWTVNEEDKMFAKGEGKVEKNEIKNIKNPNYNWGYDPHNYFSIEGWLSSNPKDPYSRISELRALIKKLHDNNIGVIADVVYNHMYDNKILDDIVPNYYFRNPGGPQPVGAPALASENKMTRKIIVESAKWLVDQYGIDGFRFDLMGFIDKETIKLIKEKVKTKEGHDIILYGESWDFSDLPKGERLVKGEISSLEAGIANVGYFNDSTRDGIKGGAGHGEALNQGFIQGNFEDAPRVRAGIIAGIKNFPQSSTQTKKDFTNIDNSPSYSRFTDEPNEAIQYLAIHDGFTLWDKINLSVKNIKNATEEEKLQYKIRLMKQAFGILLTSQGRIVIQGGDEMGRSKPLSLGDANPERANTSDNLSSLKLFPDIKDVIGNRYHENSYKASDFANSFKWDRIKKGYANSEFIKLKNYVKDLIKIRQENYEFRFETAKEIQENVRFFGEEKISNKFGPYKTLSDLNGEFKINFINAPEKYRNQRWYLAGEAAKDGLNNNMPAYVDIDFQGKGSVIIKGQAFKNLEKNINSNWGTNGNEFNFKLVKEEGSWETIDSAYAGLANTKLPISSLSSEKSATVDLLIANQKVYPENYTAAAEIIQFHIKAPNNKKYSEFIVVTNPKDTWEKIDMKLTNWFGKNKWIVLANEDGIPSSEIKADNYVAPHSTLIIARKR
ncbi:alpha-amylase family glycosyl hydrolase [Mycoplasma phocimorsus]|uniref:pullulanase-associated domain-containing protein n=1 Tax=Mycoplasma phocimorsus TaxID=3045839 RepID=UPI0024BF384D|nr:alpha-amylase family glycosyl hydrolase [Mycoplasma phocimorsus]MDJ1647529.1 alpha-amylase family glycosyl hydrolase [Mycoplasma phocimorsus]